MSVDTLQHFIYYLLFKIPKKDLHKILNMKIKSLEKFLITNYKKYFFKDEIESKKDYMFKQYESMQNNINVYPKKYYNYNNLII